MALFLLFATGTAWAQGPTPSGEYRELPGIGSRLAVWMTAQLHLNFAAFVLAVPMFALVIEFVGWRSKEQRFDRLAHEMARLLPPAFSITAILGAMMVFLLFILYPVSNVHGLPDSHLWAQHVGLPTLLHRRDPEPVFLLLLLG